jgi:hypothetical protein
LNISPTAITLMIIRLPEHMENVVLNESHLAKLIKQISRIDMYGGKSYSSAACLGNNNHRARTENLSLTNY